MEARPEDYQAPLLMAQSYDDLGRPEDAARVRRLGVECAERHLELNPDDVRGLYMAANGLAALGESGRVRSLAERALELRPEDGMVLYNVGCIFLMLGLADAALDRLEKAVANGLKQRGWYEHDSNLDALRPHQRFQKLLRDL
jgi:adenylate cyclase